jgi:hypothetical protein
MAPPPGYVGFTVFQPVVLQVCVNNYVPAAPAAPQPAPPPQPLSVKGIFDQATTWVKESQPGANPAVIPPLGFTDGFSFFEMIIQLNNLNGAKPIPAGDLIMARIKIDSARALCDAVLPTPKKIEYYEKFGDPPVDFQAHTVGCKCKSSFKQVLEYAIVADPDPAKKILAKENALRIGLTPAQITTFDAAITLRLTLDWQYDHCTVPHKSVLTFNAESLDPAQGGKVTWTLPGGPLSYAP